MYVRGRTYRPLVSPPRDNTSAVSAALADIDAGRPPETGLLRDAVRVLLAALAAKAPGRSVEVRVPPFGAIQCVTGPTHTRGTPPNVVETDPLTFVRLATGRSAWGEAVANGTVSASGVRADLSGLLPCWPQ
jgi:hypothetical protein